MITVQSRTIPGTDTGLEYREPTADAVDDDDQQSGDRILNKDAHRIMIVDDHTIMRDGLQSLLASEPGFEVVGTAADGRSAIRSVAALKPDIILMDLTMPGTSGIDAIAHIKRQHPNVRLVALTFHKEDRYIHATLEAGADAYVLKDDSRTELFTALRSVLSGKSYLSPTICDRVVAGYLAVGDNDSQEPSWEILTKREREVIKLIAEGHKTKEIAEYLSLSPKTVEKHRTNLMKKLDLHSVSAVTLYAIQNGLITQ